MKDTRLISFLVMLAFLMVNDAGGQSPDKDTVGVETEQSDLRFFSLEPAPSFNRQRFWVSSGAGLGVWTGASIIMWEAWYKDYPVSGFHTFDDSREWMGMDKFGHAQASYLHSYYTFKGARWTGLSRRNAMWASIGVSLGIQSTIEIMDGFSEEWGFSVTDMAFNVLGTGIFVAQELAWEDQRILIKVSSTRPEYSTEPLYSEDGSQVSSLDERAKELFGSTATEVFLKDYNAMTIWASFNIKSFDRRKDSRIPAWLNLALGVGAGNIYGGFNNRWEGKDGARFSLNESDYPRYSQFYLAPDIDFSRIPTRHKWVKLALSVINWIKIPSPVLAYSTQGKMTFHALYW